MSEVSLVRLYVLRATYLLIVVGLGIDVLPELFHHPATWSLMRGVVCCLLSTVAILALLGLRHPLALLPLLLFEVVWKALWLGVFGIPLARAGQLDAATRETVKACAMGLVIFPFAIPWGYAYRRYLRAPADRWRPRGAETREA